MENSLTGLPPWQLEIIHLHPRLYLEPSPPSIRRYKERGKPLPEFYCSLRYGFECRAGWADIIRDFSSDLDSLILQLRQSNAQAGAWLAPWCIKEKLGRLLLDCEHNLKPPFNRLVLSHAYRLTEKSMSVCEISSEYGQLREIAGWKIVLSDAEYVKALKEGLPR